MTGLLVVVGVLAAGTVIGFVLRGREGAVRSGQQRGELPARVAEALGPGVTLVQISTTFCAPCRHTRARLSALADKRADLSHVDIDVTNQPEIAETLGVLRTTTTIPYTSSCDEILRVPGLAGTNRLLRALLPHQSEHWPDVHMVDVAPTSREPAVSSGYVHQPADRFPRSSVRR